MDLLVLTVVVGCLIAAWSAKSPWVWSLLGLAMIVGSLLVCWWANSSLESPDREAPFVVAVMGFCTCIPLGLFCFAMAAFVALRPLKVPEVEKNGEIGGEAGALRLFRQTPPEPPERGGPDVIRPRMDRFFGPWKGP